MPEPIAILLSALIAGGLSLAAMLLNERFQRKRRLEEEKERFFYTIYNKRIESHERLLGIAGKYATALAPVGPVERYLNLANKFVKEFRGELVASRIFADEKVIEAGEFFERTINDIEVELIHKGQTGIEKDLDIKVDDVAAYGLKIRNAYHAFLETIRETAGVHSVETHLQHLAYMAEKGSQDGRKIPRGRHKQPPDKGR